MSIASSAINETNKGFRPGGPATLATTTLLHDIGGRESLESVVDVFYELVWSDPDLISFFEGVDKSWLKAHQSNFLAVALTNLPEDFDVVNFLALRHQRLLEDVGLSSRHFDRILVHLAMALKSIWMEQAVIDEVVKSLGKYRTAFQNETDMAPTKSGGSEDNKLKRKMTKALDRNERAHNTLLYRLGGEDALEATIEEFYALILQDPELGSFFQGMSLKHLKLHQLRFMKMAFTHIPKYFDLSKYLYKSHERLFRKGLCEHHFDLVAGHLVAALNSMWVEQDVIDSILDLLGQLRVVFRAQQEAESTE